ncbi:MAG: right-handed parallel beta-helix repeat-containing protein [Candidatus Lokiarchaeota archaeon]|nr:right-handed parallel beta-helix repeat-containing protein [Candidatus Lokiarchaeota archaeon]
MKIKREQLVVLLIIGLIFPLMINNNINFSDEQKTTVINPKSSGGYTVPFIHVDGSIANIWSDTADDYGWCYFDNGFYIIENVTIDADDSPTGSGILINNSKNEYFIIRNCTIFNADYVFSDSGILLENTNNGTIINNICSGNNQGIYLKDCEGNSIIENNASNNNVNGIFLQTNCDNNNITGNTANDNTFGIQLETNCDYNNITLNTVNDNDYSFGYGIYINGYSEICGNNIIFNNTANKNDDYGIYIYKGDDTSIINNTAKNNKEAGISLHSSNDINVTGNNININNKYGIYVQNCDNSNITGNTINSNLEIGIYLYSNSDSNEIKNNTINRNDLGIALDQSDYNNITGNDLKYNNWCIYETDCVGNIIEYNDCSSPTVEFPIYIDDYATGVDAHNWTWAKDRSWCSGTGTSWDPYIIENLKISGFGIIDYGIDIRNSNVSFIIRECLIYNSDQAGIYLDNVNNSRLINNNCSNNNNGIDIEYANNNTISGNTANGNNHDGINLKESDYNYITGNTVNDNDDGICIDISCDNNFLGGNFANDNRDLGISIVEECMNNNISGNTANGNYDGINLYDNCINNTISGNTAEDNDRAGIYLFECDYNSLTGNNASGNNNGIFIEDKNKNNNITGNILNNNDCGIEIYYSDFNSIIGNTANDNSDCGINIEGSNNNTISGNNANNNTNFGMILEEENNNNTISGNTVNNNKDTGIYMDDDCDYNDITENIVYNNSLGIYLYSDCGNNSIYKNLFLKNGKHSVDDGTDNKWNSTTIGNYWDNHTGPDANNDGIVDDPYTFIGGFAESIDYLPIAEDGAPVITINSPISGDGFGTTAPSFDVTVTDNFLNTMWYSIDGGLLNYTFTENDMINQTAWDALSDGPITLQFYADDLFGHIGSAGVNIIKDTIAPIIIINSPVEGAKFGKTAPLFNITVTEVNLDVMWYSFDGGVTTYAITNNTIFNQTTWTVLAPGNVTITFYVRDIAGNEATEEVTVIKSVPSGLDPGFIIIIVVVSIVGGVAVITVVYIFMKKRATP